MCSKQKRTRSTTTKHTQRAGADTVMWMRECTEGQTALYSTVTVTLSCLTFEGRGEGRARAQALPTDRYAPPRAAHAPRYVDAPPYAGMSRGGWGRS